MESEDEPLEEKLKSLLGQLQFECAIFERMVYKNKNQHRRSLYFQYLLKVRRDLRLLKSAKLEEILSSCFQVISGKRPKQKVHLLESLKRRKYEVGKYTFLERLLGAARLLSQMVDPMVKAACEISVLLARSFFMGFSLTILALLARIRVLVQQILVHVISVFNMVSSLSRKRQSVKITQDGVEVFREFFPTTVEFITLECVWESDKFVLHERTQKSEIASHNVEIEEKTSTQASSVQYQSIESFLGVDELPSEGAKADHAAEKCPTHVKEDMVAVTATDLLPGPSIRHDDGKLPEDSPKVEEAAGIAETSSKKFPQGGLFSCSSSSSNTSKPKSASRKVAFVAVKNSVPSATNATEIRLKETENKSSNKEDSFFSLLAAGSTKESLF
ncbi:hypothetical protein TIFTF001_020674 [Ficus carica]|uniref:Nucleolus and neural progenitor protein-like N-terminal domain-containing protein n=1 Tax=Ficus carica TaxID=3494 RepID=A0AA88AFD6_FICCA|nr:hypothetical protein TIFTF001_020674 [Ficus carica]